MTISKDRIPLDAALMTPRHRNALAAGRLEAVRFSIDEALKVMSRKDLVESLELHIRRIARPGR